MYKTIKIDGELHKYLKLRAVKEGVTLTELIDSTLRERAIGAKIVEDGGFNLKPIVERKDSRINAFSDPPEPVKFNPVPKPK